MITSMDNQKYWIFVLVFVFLITLGVVGAYIYLNYYQPKNAVNSVSSPTETTVTDTTSNSNFPVPNIRNGSGGSKINGCTVGAVCYPQSLGGVDDYNNGGSFPTDGYSVTWIMCNKGNNYCGTSDTFAERQDPNTGLVWSMMMTRSGNWFDANNCKYPNGLSGDDGTCDTDGEVACACVKHTGGIDPKTGCESFGSGTWRLPYQKELMQAYIDGSWKNLTDANDSYWSATTRSNSTETAWATYLSYGNTSRNNKTQEYATRCVHE